MDGDGCHEILLHLIGHGKEDASDHLCYRYGGEDWVCQDKCDGAQYYGRRGAPSPDKTIEEAPEKDLFCNGTYETAYYEKEDDVTGVRRETGIYE